jgi:hypothetical protein
MGGPDADESDATDATEPPLEGSATFVKPEALTVYTMDTVSFELASEGVEDLEIVVDEEFLGALNE